MYAVRVTFRPVLQKGPELAKVLKDRANELNRMGLPTSPVTRVVFTEGAEYQLVYFNDTFADVEAGRRRIIDAPTTAAFNQKAQGLLREMPTLRFFEYVVPLATTIKVGEFLWRGIFYLADPFQEDGLIAPTAELTKNMQKAGINAGLMREHFAAPHGQTVQSLAGLKTLASVEDFWKARAKVFAGDRALTAKVMKAWGQTEFRQPSDTELWEVMVAAPAAKPARRKK